MATVRLEHITQYADRWQAGKAPSEAVPIVQDISFTVPDGEFWVLVGPSGCGKSTLLRTIAGLMPISQGQLYIGERLVNQVPARQRDVAMVFQNYALYPHMSVAENLGFGLKMRQVPAAERQPQVAAIAQALGLEHLMARKPSQLSGGQQQRVALGRALARQPQAFLLDEPLSNLDAQLRDETRTELKQLHQQFGITTLYVTHDQVEAMTLADQIVVLDAGQIQQIGAPQAVYAKPANRMVAAFLGNPPMNLLSAVFDGDAFQLGTQSLACLPEQRSELAAGQPVWLGIRPEQVSIAQAPKPSEVLPSSPSARLSAQVGTIEPLGRETLVKVKVSGLSDWINLIVLPAQTPCPDEALTLLFPLSDLFIFDAETGQRCFSPTRSDRHTS
ncbi:MAG: ABC transporter ATP-binding protein [Leptolyngbya sp. SIO4C1]|nr:ABC transporter ATP-binding protein [Leptolyngbya sp. SIO4C1]